MNDIDELVRRHYARQRMDQERLESILRPRPRRSMGRRMALGLGMAATIGWIAATWFGNLSIREHGAGRVMAEIALNHHKQLAMEVASNDYADVGNRMSRLDFRLRRPRTHVAANELIGARYCSIDGGLAVQLRLRETAAGQAQTLFATRATDALRAMGSSQVTSDDVTIRHWVEGDTFFAHAIDWHNP